MYFFKLSAVLAVLFSLCSCDFSNLDRQQRSVPTQCSPNKPCVMPNNIKIWLSDSTIKPETPFSIFVDLPPHYKITHSQLEGITMYMGYIPQFFTEHNGVWQSDTMVGICAQRNMLWQLSLSVENTQLKQQQVLSYNFYVNY